MCECGGKGQWAREGKSESMLKKRCGATETSSLCWGWCLSGGKVFWVDGIRERL